MPLPRLATPLLCSALLLAGCASTPADLPGAPAGGPDVCAPGAAASQAQRAIARACEPQPGDRVTPEQRRQAVRALAGPLDRLNTQRHQRVITSRTRSTPQAAPSTITTDVEPGGRQRTVTMIPAAYTQRLEMVQIGEQGWIRQDRGPWQRNPAAAPLELETAAVLAQGPILAVRSGTQDGRHTLTVDTLDKGLGFKRERRIHADLTRGLITQMDFVDMDDIESTLRYDWDARFAPIAAPAAPATTAPRQRRSR